MPSAERASRVRARRIVPWALALVALALVLAAIVQSGDPDELARLVQRSRPAWLLFAVALQLGTYLTSAAVYRTALSACGPAPSLRALVGLGLVKQLTDSALPSAGLGGTLLIVRGLVRRGVPRPAAVGAVVVDLVGFYVALSLALTLAMLVLYARRGLHPATLLVAAVFGIAALGIPALALRLHRAGVRGAPRWITRWRAGRAVVRELEAAPRALLRDRATVLRVCVLQLVVVALDAATLWACLRALGTPVPLAVAGSAYVLATIAGVLSVLPAGLGVFEGGSVGVLLALGVSLEASLAATLLTRALTLWLPMLPAAIAIRGEAAPPGAAPA